MDMRQVVVRKDVIVEQSRTGLEKWLRSMEGVTVFAGPARFESPTSMRVGDTILTAPQIFLNVGARPAIPELSGIAETPFLTSSTILDLNDLPRHLIVVGGGFIGLEFAQMYRRFGAEVTVVELGPRLLARADRDVADTIVEILDGEGISLRLNAECISLRKTIGGVAVDLACTEGSPSIEGSHVLLATGRQPNTDDLNLSAAGIAVDQHGYVPVDDELRTSVAGIWALGDCNGKGAFTHTSYNDFEIVAANLLDGGSRRVSDRIPVSALYIDPPLAQIGMTEAEVRSSGSSALVGIRPMTKVGRAVEKGETLGFMKVLVDANTRRILGASILGTGGDEAIHCILTAMYARQTTHLLQSSVHIHPTVAELIPTVLGDLKPLS